MDMDEWYVCMLSVPAPRLTCIGGFSSALEADDYYINHYRNKPEQGEKHQSQLLRVFRYQPDILKRFRLRMAMLGDIPMTVTSP
jgi:hypothetical protein